MKNTLLFIIILLLSINIGFGQSETSIKRVKEKKGIIYNKEVSGGFFAHTNGWGLVGQYGKLKTYYRTDFYRIQIAEIKHPREVRQTKDYKPSPFSNAPKSFIYGKVNNFYPIHVSYGQKRYFSEKARQRGVAVGLSYSLGPSLGLLKPYYLDIQESPNDLLIARRKYSLETAGEFLNIGKIRGASGFAYGWDELDLTFGGHGQIGVHLDWGAFDAAVKAIEAGLMVDLYYQKVPLMVSEDNSPIFINLYIAIELGKRW